MKTKILATLSLLCLVLPLSACAAGAQNPSPESKTAAAETSTSESSATYPVKIDNYGRHIEVTAAPQKVLTLGPNCTELLVALGLEGKIVGRSLVNHSRGPLPEYAQAVEKIPQLNYGSATRERILSSGADFIYALDWEISDEGLNLEEAAGYGMTTYVNSSTTLEAQYQEILDLGKIFGISERAQAFVADQRQRIAAVGERLAGQDPVEVLIYDSGRDGVFTATGANFESLLVEAAGGHNIFADLGKGENGKQWTSVSFEEVLARNPQVILIHDYDRPGVEEKIAEIKANPTLASLEAVKQERFATITLESVLPGDRMAYAVEHLAQAFHPEK